MWLIEAFSDEKGGLCDGPRQLIDFNGVQHVCVVRFSMVKCHSSVLGEKGVFISRGAMETKATFEWSKDNIDEQGT